MNEETRGGLVEYELVGMDAADARFAISPINELVRPLRTFRDPGRYRCSGRSRQRTSRSLPRRAVSCLRSVSVRFAKVRSRNSGVVVSTVASVS